MNDADCMEKLAKAGTRNRATTIQEICKDLNIPYQTATFGTSVPYTHLMTNIYLLGEGDLWLMAHHDVMLPDSHNANDNTASVVNAIRCKQRLPWLNVAFTDGEESPFLGTGSRAFASVYTQAHVINLELTGAGGGKSLAVDRGESPLAQFFSARVPQLIAPFSDACVLQQCGIDSTCIFTCTDGYSFNIDLLRRSHTMSDNLDSISIHDMEDFRERLIEIIEEMKGGIDVANI